MKVQVLERLLEHGWPEQLEPIAKEAFGLQAAQAHPLELLEDARLED